MQQPHKEGLTEAELGEVGGLGSGGPGSKDESIRLVSNRVESESELGSGEEQQLQRFGRIRYESCEIGILEA